MNLFAPRAKSVLIIFEALTISLVASIAQAGGIPTANLPDVIVTGRLDRLQGEPTSASQGIVTAEQLELRPVLRTGELLEVVPGLIVTQHSGDGKANQYFLRGFNLDHGTDLATSVDGVPVNMPTHAHGQGYTDLNFVIPELVQSIEYRKGTYYADTGNFSAAGAVALRYKTELDKSLATLEVGQENYRRALLAFSPDPGVGKMIVGAEYTTNDGPWQLPEGFRKVNGVVKYSIESGATHYSISAQGYSGRWRSTDQIPLRAVESGSIDRFGYIDPTDGGESHRYSINFEAATKQGNTELVAQAYAVNYKLDLFSDFTYALEDPVNGDQFEQYDDRRIYGAELRAMHPFALGTVENFLQAGFQWRRDDIGTVGLYHTVARQRLNTVREDKVLQSSYSGYASLDSHLGNYLKTIIGVRVDRFDFDVDSSLSLNSGTTSATLASPKFSAILGPWQKTEFFANIGRGFHSNDARGTTITVDPSDGVTPVDKVDPLVKALGIDLGLRTAIVPKAQFTVSLWQLRLDSELLFVGDAGVTEPSRRSLRRGVEIGAIYNPLQWVIVDADIAWSRSKFDDDDPIGDHIPNAVGQVASVGIALNHPRGFGGGIRFRHFGSAPLIEDNSVRSSPTTIVNLEGRYGFADDWRVTLAVFNVFNRRDNDITYFYASQLRGESTPTNDIHFHPVEPRTLRASITKKF